MAAVPHSTLSSARSRPTADFGPRPSATVLRFSRARIVTPVAPDRCEGRAIAQTAGHDLAAAWLVFLALAIATVVVS